MMMNRSCGFSFLQCACLVLGLFLSLTYAIPANAQVAGATLSGLVTDENGSAVAGASVSVKNLGTGDVRELTTNGDGFYSTPNLIPGSYEVQVTAKGFRTLI